MFLDPQRRSSRSAVANLLLPLLLLQGAVIPALAQERTVPAPKQVIYPGDVIRDAMLTDISVDGGSADDGSIVGSRAALIGKIAKRTLLPGREILAIAIENPRAVANGAHVTLVYRDGALTIATSAQALEPGGVGDTIKVRNDDSGLTVSGKIQPDGSVSVSAS
jgi:flagella basal body P-ring formation protein FlgA